MRSVGTALVKLIATATSGLVSFTTNVIRPVKVTCEFSPVQEGTGDPSPDNVRPISGWTGCDIWHSKSRNLIPLPSGFTTSGFNKQVTNTDIVNALQNNLISGRSYRCWMEGTYESSGNAFTDSSNNGIQITVGGSNYTMRAKTTMVMPNGTITKVVFISGSSGTSGNRLFSKLLVREVSDTHTLTVDDYEPYYQPTTLPINWQSEAGTVYGGTVTLNEDGSADLVATQALWVEDGTRQPSYAVWNTSDEGELYNRTLFGRLPHPQHDYAGGYKKYFSSDNRKFTPSINDGEWRNKFCFASYRAAGASFAYSIPKNLSTKAEVAAYFAENPTTVVYPLETPLTYHFSNIGQLQSFLGTNNIWHNMNGSITAEYYKKQ